MSVVNAVMNRVKAVPTNAKATLQDVKNAGVVPAIVNSGTRVGSANRAAFNEAKSGVGYGGGGLGLGFLK